MITRVTLQNAKWREKRSCGSRRVAPWGNECKCIEIIILSRRITYAPLHVPGYTSAVVLLRVKGLKGGIRGDRYFLSSVLVCLFRCRLTIIYSSCVPAVSSPSAFFFLSNLSAALIVVSARSRLHILLVKQKKPLSKPKLEVMLSM